jgi:adenosylhomocysteine nucleosidase
VSRLGVVVGYRAEARCLTGCDLRVLCSGVDPERARTAAARLCDQGAAGLVSFGLAGGLVPDLAPGDLLLPQHVILPEVGRLMIDPAWRGRLAATLERAGLRARSEPIVGSERIVATRAAKRALRAQTGAVAVDMESHGVAEVALRAHLPFLVVRAIADRGDQVVPRSALGAIDANGEVRHLALLGRLIGRPWDLWPVIELGRSSGRGLATLSRVALLAPGLDFA